ncbi:MAG: N-acetylmuramoyl-L-alanine amidase [Oscillospiraceae bacterium]|nr:N-acetylmuramoyl-L-alanine amidase [Oscillospiraceae bacterium]
MKTILADGANYKAGRQEPVSYLVMHFSGNNGDTAESNGNFFKNNKVQVSAHYFVDENEIVVSVPETDTAWHCGDSGYRHPKCRNANSIGIALCSREDIEGNYYFCKETVQRAETLVRLLMNKYGIKSERVLRHYDVTGKKCPAPFVENPAAWNAFLQSLQPDLGEVGGWAQEVCHWASAKELFAGTEKWKDPTTREAVAAILYRFAVQLEK